MMMRKGWMRILGDDIIDSLPSYLIADENDEDKERGEKIGRAMRELSLMWVEEKDEERLILLFEVLLSSLFFLS